MATGHFDWSGHPEILTWFEKIKGEIPNYEKSNGAGATAFGEMFKKAVAKEWFLFWDLILYVQHYWLVCGSLNSKSWIYSCV